MNRNRRLGENIIKRYAPAQGFGKASQIWTDSGVTIQFPGKQSLHVSHANMSMARDAGTKPFHTLLQRAITQAHGTE